MKKKIGKFSIIFMALGMMFGTMDVYASPLGPLTTLPPGTRLRPPQGNQPSFSIGIEELKNHGTSLCLPPDDAKQTDSCLQEVVNCGIVYFDCALNNPQTQCTENTNDHTQLVCLQDPRPICDGLISDEPAQTVRDNCPSEPVPTVTQTGDPLDNQENPPPQNPSESPVRNAKGVIAGGGCSLSPSGTGTSIGASLVFFLTLIPMILRMRKEKEKR